MKRLFPTKLSWFTSQLDDKTRNSLQNIQRPVRFFHFFCWFQNCFHLFSSNANVSVLHCSSMEIFRYVIERNENLPMFCTNTTKAYMENNDFSSEFHVHAAVFVSGNDELSFFPRIFPFIVCKILLLSSRLRATTTPHSRMKIECEEKLFFIYIFGMKNISTVWFCFEVFTHSVTSLIPLRFNRKLFLCPNNTKLRRILRQSCRNLSYFLWFSPNFTLNLKSFRLLSRGVLTVRFCRVNKSKSDFQKSNKVWLYFWKLLQFLVKKEFNNWNCSKLPKTNICHWKSSRF